MPLLSRLRHRPTLVALLVAAAFFMENLDGTVIATALPPMAQSFATTPEALAIGMTAYLLTLAVCIPASGWVADRFGPRQVFASAIVGFTAASILCGLATSVATFTAARILQGAAGALMVPVGRLVVLRGTDKRDLLSAIATLTWPALVAPILGPPVGGFITHLASWRWIFFINVPIGIVEFVLALILVDGPPDEARRPFDAPGFVLNGASLAVLLFALDRLGAPGTAVGPALALLGFSLALCAAAVWRALRHRHPLVSLEAFTNHTFTITMTGGSMSRIAISTMPFLLPLLFQVGLGMNAFASGLFVLWYGVTNLAIKPFTTPILRRFGFRAVLIGNSFVNAASIAGCALIGPGTPGVAIAVLLMLAGAARSMQYTALNTLAFTDLPPSMTSAANTLFNMAFQLAVALGIAVGAMALRAIGAVLPDGAGPLEPFRIAFLLIGCLTLLPLAEFLRLGHDAGSVAIARPVKAPAA